MYPRVFSDLPARAVRPRGGARPIAMGDAPRPSDEIGGRPPPRRARIGTGSRAARLITVIPVVAEERRRRTPRRLPAHRAPPPRCPGRRCRGGGIRHQRRARLEHVVDSRHRRRQLRRRHRAPGRAGRPLRGRLLHGGRGVHLDAGTIRAVPAGDRDRAQGDRPASRRRVPGARPPVRAPRHAGRARPAGGRRDDVRSGARPRDPRPRGARNRPRLDGQADTGGRLFIRHLRRRGRSCRSYPSCSLRAPRRP